MDIIIGILSDCLGAKGLPTGAASAALGRVMEKRHAVLREVVMAELRQGNFENIDEEELIGVFFRLIRSAEEGVARNNLRLMARVINGMAEKQELKAPTFLKYANILASLTEEEIKVLGIMAQKLRNPYYGMPNPDTRRVDYAEPEQEALKKAVPNYPVVQQALVRTGLVFFRVDSQAGEDFSLDGGSVSDPESGHFKIELYSKVEYQLTPLMKEILTYCRNFTVGYQGGEGKAA